ncbi:MAG: hypothetical protein II200_01965 [Bacteroidaceae bacterium]|nr:hypothetical protein [Bacteroidaceae bacterium]
MKKTYIAPSVQTTALELQGIVASSVKMQIFDKQDDPGVDPSSSLTQELCLNDSFWE